MRIVGGKYKSRVLTGFEGNEVRPTSDRAREVVFNDISKNSLAILKKNLTLLKVEIGKEAILKNYDYLTCLDCVIGAFDLIFIDPPYRFDYGEKA